MKENSGSQLFRTTTRIPSEPNAFDKSRFIMTFLTILGVTEILCSFRLVLEVKTGKEIPESSRIDFLEKCFQQTILLYQMQKITTPVRVRQLAYIAYVTYTYVAFFHTPTFIGICYTYIILDIAYVDTNAHFFHMSIFFHIKFSNFFWFL